MGAVVGAVVSSVVTSAATATVTAAVGTGFAATAISYGIGAVAGMAASSLLSGALSKKKPSGGGSVGPVARSETIRQTLAMRDYVYGRTQKSGALIYHYTSGDNQFYYQAIVVASHKIQEIEKITIADFDMPISACFATDTSYSTTGVTHYKCDRGLFADHMWLDIGLGTTGNQANTRFVSECGGTFSSTDKFEEMAVIYLKLKHNPELFSNVPNVKVTMKGKSDIVDTRDSSTAYTANAALCANDYIKDNIVGLNMGAARITTATVDTSADVCDESVPINDRYSETPILDITAGTEVSEKHSAVSAADNSTATTWNGTTASDYIEISYSSAEQVNKIIMTAPTEHNGIYMPSAWTLKGSNTGAFGGEETTITSQSGLSWTGGEEKEWEFANASSYVYNRLEVSTTTQSSLQVGILRMLTLETSENRYEINGAFSADSKPEDILDSMFMAMAGALSYTNGKLRMVPGEYQTPAITITEDQVLSPMNLSRPGRRDKFNAVRGVYIKELNNWKSSDFPHVTNSTYETADGERLYADLEMPFTITESAAQRIGKIQLERARQDISCEILLSIDLWDIAAGDTVMLTYSPWGFSSKVFDVTERSTVIIDDGAGGKIIALRVSLRETASTVYSWSLEETTVDPAPNTNLPNASVVDSPLSITLDSTEANLIRGANGRLVTRIKVSWDLPTNVFVTEGGVAEIQYKLSSSSTWLSARSVDGGQNFGYVVDVDDRETYDVRVRFLNTQRSKSDFTTESNHVVIGKTTPPPRVQDFVASPNGINVSFAWTESSVLDVRGYEIRFGPQGVQWKDATPLETEKQGNAITSSSVPPGTWSFLIKAIDAVGLYSNIASVSGPITVSNANSILSAIDDGEFPGTLDNFVKHYTNVLVPDDQNLASSYDFEVFDQAVPTPEIICTYTSPEIDLLSDQDVRIWGNIESSLLPGVTTGIANPKLQVCYRSSTDSSSGSDVVTELVTSTGTFTNCIQHYNGSIVPDSQSLANVTSSFEVFDNFVYDAYPSCSYEAPEQDFGADGNVNLTLAMGAALGPGETGSADASSLIDHKTSSGSYDGFESYTTGTINARYYKAKVEWDNTTSVSYISDFDAEVSCWRTWIIGEVDNVRYVQARIVSDTSEGLHKITDFNWTIDAP